MANTKKVKPQTVFLEAAGFTISLVFEPCEQVFFEERLLEVIDVYKKAGFVKKTSKKSDFKIIFRSNDKNSIEIHRKNNKHYYLTFIRSFEKNTVETFYYIGLIELQILIKEVFSHLLERNNGFMLHSSGVMDRSGNLKLFMAKTGGGKTTVSNLLASTTKYKKFCDDVVIVRKVGGNWKYSSPPFVEKTHISQKMSAVNSRLFFVKKSKKALVKPVKGKGAVIKPFLEQIWFREEKINPKTLSSALEFIENHDFWVLNSVLDVNKLKGALDET